eukprot:1157308-Pelagomonas_calceolata.AAC.21
MEVSGYRNKRPPVKTTDCLTSFMKSKMLILHIVLRTKGHRKINDVIPCSLLKFESRDTQAKPGHNTRDAIGLIQTTYHRRSPLNPVSAEAAP